MLSTLYCQRGDSFISGTSTFLSPLRLSPSICILVELLVISVCVASNPHLAHRERRCWHHQPSTSTNRAALYSPCRVTPRLKAWWVHDICDIPLRHNQQAPKHECTTFCETRRVHHQALVSLSNNAALLQRSHFTRYNSKLHLHCDKRKRNCQQPLHLFPIFPFYQPHRNNNNSAAAPHSLPYITRPV